MSNSVESTNRFNPVLLGGCIGALAFGGSMLLALGLNQWKPSSLSAKAVDFLMTPKGGGATLAALIALGGAGGALFAPRESEKPSQESKSSGKESDASPDGAAKPDGTDTALLGDGGTGASIAAGAQAWQPSSVKGGDSPPGSIATHRTSEDGAAAFSASEPATLQLSGSAKRQVLYYTTTHPSNYLPID